MNTKAFMWKVILIEISLFNNFTYSQCETFCGECVGIILFHSTTLIFSPVCFVAFLRTVYFPDSTVFLTPTFPLNLQSLCILSKHSEWHRLLLFLTFTHFTPTSLQQQQKRTFKTSALWPHWTHKSSPSWLCCSQVSSLFTSLFLLHSSRPWRILFPWQLTLKRHSNFYTKEQ